MKRKSQSLFDDAMSMPAASRAALGEKLLLSAYDVELLRDVATELERHSEQDPRPDVPAATVLRRLRKKYP